MGVVILSVGGSIRGANLGGRYYRISVVWGAHVDYGRPNSPNHFAVRKIIEFRLYEDGHINYGKLDPLNILRWTKLLDFGCMGAVISIVEC